MDHYTDSLKELAKESGLLKEIFTQAQNRFNNPVSLKKLLHLIEEDEWTSMDVDLKGAAFEGLLEKAASEGKKGANQVPERDNFTVEISNKQLYSVQHIMSTLKTGGLAAIVLPDNVLDDLRDIIGLLEKN